MPVVCLRGSLKRLAGDRTEHVIEGASVDELLRELERDFPAFEVGAMPPFATTPLPEVVDLRLLHHDRIVCAGGEHRRSVRLSPLELLRITEPRVADICEHPEDRELADRRESF